MQLDGPQTRRMTARSSAEDSDRGVSRDEPVSQRRRAQFPSPASLQPTSEAPGAAPSLAEAVSRSSTSPSRSAAVGASIRPTHGVQLRGRSSSAKSINSAERACRRQRRQVSRTNRCTKRVIAVVSSAGGVKYRSVQFFASHERQTSYFDGSLQKRTRVVRSWACFANAPESTAKTRQNDELACCKTLGSSAFGFIWPTAAQDWTLPAAARHISNEHTACPPTPEDDPVGPTTMESLKQRMQTRDEPPPPPAQAPAKATTTVAARVRPWLTALDGPNDIASTSAVSATGVRVRSQGDAGRGRGFRLHHAVSADDATFCETVIAPLADLASRGGTACVVFYGASGAGKTHSARARPSALPRNGSSKQFCRRVLPRDRRRKLLRFT